MFFASETDNDETGKYFINVDFGSVPVGSVHHRSIDIKNDLKKSKRFKVKNNNESMYLADSISFKPSVTSRIFPNKKTKFSITFSPKTVHIPTTLEYYTIFAIDDQIDKETDEEIENEELNDEIVQKVTVRVQGSCYGPSVKIFPTEVFMNQSTENKQTMKSINLINNSKMPALYHVQYDWANSPLKCHPSFGVIESRVQIKLELKPCRIQYYYKRLYILIANHPPVYVDVYAFSSTTKILNPFSYFGRPFEPLVRGNGYIDFFKDVAHSATGQAIPKPQVVVSPRELHFGYAKNAKTLSFEVRNNSDSVLCVDWIRHELCNDNDPFEINPKRFHIEGHETKTFECVFRPKTVSNVFAAELEATVYFDPSLLPSSNRHVVSKKLPDCVSSANISITATGSFLKKHYNAWKPKCKLSDSVIVMPPSVPASEAVFATFYIKKVVPVPMTFEFRPPDKSIFMVKPKSGVINGDYQIVVFRFLPPSNKESLYAERWNIVFDGFVNDPVTVDVYASVEFGCVAIGEKNHVVAPDSVQVGYKTETRVPIVNMTRHRLRYYVKIHDQRPESVPSLAAYESEYEGLETEETVLEGTEAWSESTGGADVTMQGRCKTFTDNDDPCTLSDRDSNDPTACDDDDGTTLSFIEPSGSINRLTNRNAKTALAAEPDRSSSSSFVFQFDEPTGELGPNEKRHLNLTFCPLKSVPYTAKAKCYLICNDFPGIVTTLPVVIEGSGCTTELKITPNNCHLKDTVINMKTTRTFVIENKSRSYAKVKILTKPTCSGFRWPVPTCRINPKTFQFTPEQNHCKIDLTVRPTELGFQKFYVSVELESKTEPVSKNDNLIVVGMDVVTCGLQISSVTNDSIPYFGKWALDKIFHRAKINDELNKVFTENTSPLILTVPVITESTLFEFQFYNLSKIPINWTIKYNKCIPCTSEKNTNNYDRNKECGTLPNKCEHRKNIQISPTVNVNMNHFSNLKIELNNINTDGLMFNYKWSSGINKMALFNTEWLIQPKVFNDGLISFDTKYGESEHLEYNFLPVYIAHPNPPAQAFWMFNNNTCSIQYSIFDDPSKPAYPYFKCLNPCGTIRSKEVHPILYVFTPDKLCKFEAATVMLLPNNNQRHITLVGQGESYSRTTILPGHCLSSFLPMKNDRLVFLSTENIILKPMSTCSKINAMVCLYNNSVEDIMYEWKKCTVENILSANVVPFKGNLKGRTSQVFEITIISYNQPATLTIMFDVSYMLVSQNEKYLQSLRNYKINKDKLDGVFIINECGQYKPKLNMILENQPQEKHLVLDVFVRIIDRLKGQWINDAKNNTKKLSFLPGDHQLQRSDDFRNILWSIVDNICSNEIEHKPLYYYQLRKSNEKSTEEELITKNQNNLEIILKSLIKDSLINIFPTNKWNALFLKNKV